MVHTLFLSSLYDFFSRKKSTNPEDETVYKGDYRKRHKCSCGCYPKEEYCHYCGADNLPTVIVQYCYTKDKNHWNLPIFHHWEEKVNANT